MSKEIWIPKSETSATVVDGKVEVITEMMFYSRSVADADAPQPKSIFFRPSEDRPTPP